MFQFNGVLSRSGRAAILSALILSLLLLPSPAMPEGEEQSYSLSYFGKNAGKEDFEIRSDPASGSLLIEAHAVVTLGGRNFDMKQKLRVKPESLKLVDYDLYAIVGGHSQSIRAFSKGDSLVVAIEAPGVKLREALFEPDGVFVLDNLLLNHLALLGNRISAGGFKSENIRVVVPQVGKVMPAAIVPQEPGPDGKRLVEVKIAEVTEDLHFDEDGKLYRVEVPTQGIRYDKVDPSGSPATPSPRTGGFDQPVPETPSSPARQLYEEQVIRFVSNGTDLDGILTLPRGGQSIPYPAVLFVHGSGPLDRDETIGPNRPFLELARGLAVYGIASFRYDKRTLAAPETFDRARGTVNEEVIYDAIEALNTLRSQSRIDRSRLLIVGHSLGGGLAATIANQGGPVAALVLLAGSPRPLDELIVDQLSYLRDQARQLGTIGDEQEQMYEFIFSQIDSLQAGTLPDASNIMGGSGYYFKEYRSRDLAADLLAFPGPVLFLQGGKDYQVTQTDFDMWKKITSDGGKKNVLFRHFPDLGHLFIPIQGEPSPAAVMRAGQIDAAVMDEISRFVESLPKNR